MVVLNIKSCQDFSLLTAISDKGQGVKIVCEWIEIPYFVQMLREAASYHFKFDHTFLN